MALPMVSAGLLPLAASAADVCNRISGKGLFDGVCQECFNEGRCQIADFFMVGNSVVKLILGLSGSVMLLMVIYGGFLWLASGGNSNMVEKGKKVLIGAIIGLIIVFGAYTATQFLVAALLCTEGSSCPVSDIFSRPFQVVKPPDWKSGAPTPTAGGSGSSPTTAPSGNPTAGTPAVTGTTGCSCSGKFRGLPVTKSVCDAAANSGLNCIYGEGECDCAGLVSVTQDKCSPDGVRSAFGIPNVPGVNYTANCNWLNPQEGSGGEGVCKCPGLYTSDTAITSCSKDSDCAGACQTGEGTCSKN